MNRIYKYPFGVMDNFILELPEGARILDVQTQFGKPVLWAVVNPDVSLEKRYFLLVGTGHPAPEGYSYIGTFQILDGQFVGHLFEDAKQRQQEVVLERLRNKSEMYRQSGGRY